MRDDVGRFMTTHEAYMKNPAWSDAEPLSIIRLARDDKDYPALLHTLSDPPAWLQAKGSLAALQKPAVAVVGSRRCDARAWTLAFALSREVASRGWCVVSGLARGIDTAAHKGALASGVPGSTIAVFGTGIDVVYPRENAELACSIVNAQGLLLSPFALGTPPLARHFPQRNCIVAGLGLAAIVVQAAIASGSMITARLAADLGREVLAVPGPPGDPLSAGPHALIRQGAALLESAADLWSVFGLYHHITERKLKHR